MSKRKQKSRVQVQGHIGVVPSDLRLRLRTLNARTYNITVSAPMLVFVQRMSTDQAFRDKVTKLM